MNDTGFHQIGGATAQLIAPAPSHAEEHGEFLSPAVFANPFGDSVDFLSAAAISGMMGQHRPGKRSSSITAKERAARRAKQRARRTAQQSARRRA